MLQTDLQRICRSRNIKAQEVAFCKRDFLQQACSHTHFLKIYCSVRTLLDTLTVCAGSALCNRLLQSHTLGKGSGLTALNMSEGQCLISEHFVLTIHRRDIFLLNKEIHARGLPSMELTVGWGTEVHA